MKRELYEVCSRTLEKDPGNDQELSKLLDAAESHALKALQFEKDEDRRHHERDQEIYLARLNLERYEYVNEEVQKRNFSAPRSHNNSAYQLTFND